MTSIKVTWTAVDGYRLTRSYKSLAPAQKFAQFWCGRFPDIAGTRYAVSGDGVGTITVIGATLADLFPADTTADADDYDGAPDPDAAYERHLETRYSGMDSDEARAFGRWEDVI